MFFYFLKALDEQEETLKQQIVHLEKQVKESTPDKAKLKELQDSVKNHEKGKKSLIFIVRSTFISCKESQQFLPERLNTPLLQCLSRPKKIIQANGA